MDEILGLNSTLAKVQEEDVVCGTCTTKKGRERESNEINDLVISFGKFEEVCDGDE